MDLANYVVVVKGQDLGVFELADHPGKSYVRKVVIAVGPSYIGVDASCVCQLDTVFRMRKEYLRNHVCLSILGSF